MINTSIEYVVTLETNLTDREIRVLQQKNKYEKNFHMSFNMEICRRFIQIPENLINDDTCTRKN